MTRLKRICCLYYFTLTAIQSSSWCSLWQPLCSVTYVRRGNAFDHVCLCVCVCQSCSVQLSKALTQKLHWFIFGVGVHLQNI